MEIVIETISVDQIPFDTMERTMGIPSSVFLQASNAMDIIEALTTLTNGRSALTPMIDLQDFNLGYRYARFSLYRAQGRYHMRVHPVRNQEEFDNEFNLTEEQIEDLYKGEIVMSLVDPYSNGEKIPCLIQLIPDTNAQVCCPCDSLVLPRTLGGKELTDEMRETLTTGRKLTILMDDNQAIDVEIDLTSPNVLKVRTNNDRLLRSAAANGQEQHVAGMGAVLGSSTKSSSAKKSKNKSKSGQAGTSLAPVQAGQTEHQSNSQSQITKRPSGVKR